MEEAFDDRAGEPQSSFSGGRIQNEGGAKNKETLLPVNIIECSLGLEKSCTIA